jgi:hypothetical protein
MSQLPAPLVLANQPKTWEFIPRKQIADWPGLGDTIRSILEKPFEQSQIKRDVKRHTDGFEPVYVEASTIIQRLNDTFNSAWDFEIVSKELLPPGAPTQVVIQGRLTVRGPVTVVKEQFGSCFLKMYKQTYHDLGSDYKAAATDALKKCATQLGIALDLYVKDESPMQGLHRTGGTEGHGSFAAQQTNPNLPAEAFQIDAVRNLFAKLNVPDGQWQVQLQLASPQQVTQGLVQSILSGAHPYVQALMKQTGQSVGLQASAA